MTLTKNPLASPSPLQAVTPQTVITGQPIPPIERIRLFSDKQWEDFVLEWADSLKQRYQRVAQCGGAGDMGRDIIASESDDADDPWDNYQCKHYKDRLAPGHIWIELGKLAYYTKQREYTYPRKYFFVAPQGAGTKLSNLLRKPDALRAGLLAQWDTHCRDQITSTGPVPLDADMLAYINKMDFSIFSAVSVLKVIDEHRKTPWYVARFGGGLPRRPAPDSVPDEPAAHETVFVRELLRAYADHLRKPVERPSDLDGSMSLREHFHDARLEFYSAEALRMFSRDALPRGDEFSQLQDELLSGIGDDLRGEHPDGYRRVVAVVKTARQLQLTAHPLQSTIVVRDRGGICHQLANDGKVRWVQ